MVRLLSDAVTLSSMFLIDLEDATEQGALEMESIPKSASDFVHSFELWFDDLRVSEENLLTEPRSNS